MHQLVQYRLLSALASEHRLALMPGACMQPLWLALGTREVGHWAVEMWQSSSGCHLAAGSLGGTAAGHPLCPWRRGAIALHLLDTVAIVCFVNRSGWRDAALALWFWCTQTMKWSVEFRFLKHISRFLGKCSNIRGRNKLFCKFCLLIFFG